MSADTLVKRLRKHGGSGFIIGTEAADRIEALEAELRKLVDRDLSYLQGYASITRAEVEAARWTLKGTT